MTTTTWLAPPAPIGQAGARKGGGTTATGLTNTELGDAVEAALAAEFGWSPANADRIGPFDLRAGADVYEVKAVTRQATEYKAKPKKVEVARKIAYAAEHDLTPHMLIAVVDDLEVHAYARSGVGAYRLTTPEAGWMYLGTTTLEGNDR